MLSEILGTISNALYSYILIFLLILGGIYFFIRTRALPIRLIGEAIRVIKEPPSDASEISSFRALMVSTASRVGVGNIAGVASAIALGGPGAVFWMWLIATVGSSSAFIESTLAQIYKRKSVEGPSFGGPAYYITQGLGLKPLAVIFAIALIVTYAGGFNMVAAFNFADAWTSYSFYDKSTTPMIVGLVMAILTALSIFKGAQHLTKVTGVVVPIMAILYLICGVFIIATNLHVIPSVFAAIFREAFDWPAIFGAFGGSAVMLGIKRGLYSNEAGVGSAPNAAAVASVSHPVKQGLVQMLSVFIDTMIICTITALTILCSGALSGGEPTITGAPLVQAALSTKMGEFGHHFVTFSLFCFAFTTLIGNFFYAEVNLRFLLNRTPKQIELALFRGAACVIVFIGAQLEFAVAWDIADILMGIMALINMPVIIILGNQAIKAMKDYEAQRKALKEQGDTHGDPVFKAANIGITKKLDYWQ